MLLIRYNNNCSPTKKNNIELMAICERMTVTSLKHYILCLVILIGGLVWLLWNVTRKVFSCSPELIFLHYVHLFFNGFCECNTIVIMSKGNATLTVSSLDESLKDLVH